MSSSNVWYVLTPRGREELEGVRWNFSEAGVGSIVFSYAGHSTLPLTSSSGKPFPAWGRMGKDFYAGPLLLLDSFPFKNLWGEPRHRVMGSATAEGVAALSFPPALLELLTRPEVSPRDFLWASQECLGEGALAKALASLAATYRNYESLFSPL